MQQRGRFTRAHKLRCSFFTHPFLIRAALYTRTAHTFIPLIIYGSGMKGKTREGGGKLAFVLLQGNTLFALLRQFPLKKEKCKRKILQSNLKTANGLITRMDVQRFEAQ